MKEKNETTRQFEEIYKQYTDPIEIQKRLNEKKRKIIKEDKLSSFGIYESDKGNF